MRARLIVDAMGHASPLVRQARWGQPPDGVCLVVGSCAAGFPPPGEGGWEGGGDLIATDSDIEPLGSAQLPTQLFWECFPAGSGADHRTTYMFCYSDALPGRPSLEEMLEQYWRRLARYHGLAEGQAGLRHLRVLYGFFPSYARSPLPPQWDRVVQIGDASGLQARSGRRGKGIVEGWPPQISVWHFLFFCLLNPIFRITFSADEQSPVSFGGFGATTRHLPRVSVRLDEALRADALSRGDLRGINPYLPSLSSTWLFQRAMSVGSQQRPAPDFINRLLATNFRSMRKFGDVVIRPFLQVRLSLDRLQEMWPS